MTGSHLDTHYRWSSWGLILLVVALLLGTRLAYLDSDLSSVRYGVLWGDEQLYNVNAKNAVLFGGPSVQHSQWFPMFQSPGHTFLMYAWFSGLGVSVLSARSLAAVWGLFLLVAFWSALRTLTDGHTQAGRLWAATALLGLDCLFFFYSRIALPEVAILVFLFLSLWAQAKTAEALDHGSPPLIRWSIAAGASLSLGLIMKLSFLIVAFSTLTAFTLFFVLNAPRELRLRVFRIEWPCFLVPAGLVFLLLYLSDPASFAATLQAQIHRAPRLDRVFDFVGGSAWLTRQNLAFPALLLIAVADGALEDGLDLGAWRKRDQLIFLCFCLAVFGSATLNTPVRRQLFWFPVGYLFLFSRLFFRRFPSAEGSSGSDCSALCLVGLLCHAGLLFLVACSVGRNFAVGVAALFLVVSVARAAGRTQRLEATRLLPLWRRVRLACLVPCVVVFVGQNGPAIVRQLGEPTDRYARAIAAVNGYAQLLAEDLGRDPVIATPSVPLELDHPAFFSSDYVNPLTEYSRRYGFPDLILTLEYVPGTFYHREFIERHGYRLVLQGSFPYYWDGHVEARWLLFRNR